MKNKINSILVLFIIVIFSGVGCTGINQQTPNKTSFYLNEEAVADHFKLVLNDIQETNYFQDVFPENDTYLNLEFKITNISKEAQIIKPIDSFKLILEENTYIDLNHNKDIIIPAGQSVMYKVIYDVPEEDNYVVYFYSGVVSNNIKFLTK